MSFGLATCVHTLYTRYHMLYATHIKCTDAKTDFSRRCCGRVRLWRRRSALLVRCRIRNDMREISTNQREPPLQPIFPPPPLMPEYDVMHSLEHGWGTGRVQETNVVLRNWPVLESSAQARMVSPAHAMMSSDAGAGTCS